MGQVKNTNTLQCFSHLSFHIILSLNILKSPEYMASYKPNKAITMRHIHYSDMIVLQ